MKKNMTKQIALLFSCALLALAGCNKPENTDETPTLAPTQVATEAPAPTEATAPTAAPTDAAEPTTVPTTEPTATTAPTAEPTATSTPTPEPTATSTPTPEPTATSTPTPEPTATSTPTPVPTATSTPTPEPTKAPAAAATVTSSNAKIESITVQDAHTLLVTLNGALADASTVNISFKKYNVDWSSYKEVKGNLTVTGTSSTTNAEGKTVLVYTVADTLRTTSAVIEKKASNFSNLASAVTLADNYITWQMDHGGWDKKIDGKTPWKEGLKKNKGSGWTGKNGELIGTIDNEGTYTQIRHIAAVYREVPEAKYQESVLKGLDFLFNLQYESGGFAQVYPKRGNYSDMVTFNDNAMVNVLYMLEDALYGRYPFDSDIIPADYKVKLQDSIDRAIDYILKSQIVSQGKLTAWCAQHDPVTYEPVAARAYELASISGQESIPVIQFLMNQEQTPEIKAAVEAAIQWLKESELTDTEYVRDGDNGVYFKNTTGHRTWYRFYEIDTNLPIFCDRDGIMKHDIMEIGTERRHGYAWAGDWGKKVTKAYDQYGYVTGTITATIAESNATFTIGQ